MAELAQIGLPAAMMALAEHLGFDAFMDVWRLLSSRPELRNDSNQIELCVRPIHRWETYQRNRYIETLVKAGVKPSELRQHLQEKLGESIGERQALRLVSQARHRLRERERHQRNKLAQDDPTADE